MKKIALFGAGKIGVTIAHLLVRSGRYQVLVCDIDKERAESVARETPPNTAHELRLDDEKATMEILSAADAVVSALPYTCNEQVVRYALKSGVHYFDLTEDVRSRQFVEAESKEAKSCFMPQCGLAPGFISIAANELVRSFEKVDTVKMRVGALPIFPSNKLKYNLTWSTDGLINEYANPCELIDNGELTSAFPLEGYERFSLDGDEYEAFNTSGGLGTLCETLAGKVRKLDYKSVRYPGHQQLVSFLMQDLRFYEDRETLKQVFERSISTTAQDKCLIFVEVRGWIEDRFVQKTYASTVYNRYVGEKHLGAIQVTTASGVCTPLDMVLNGALEGRTGVVRLEELSLFEFLENEFGHYYRDEKALRGIEAGADGATGT